MLDLHLSGYTHSGLASYVHAKKFSGQIKCVIGIEGGDKTTPSINVYVWYVESVEKWNQFPLIILNYTKLQNV